MAGKTTIRAKSTRTWFEAGSYGFHGLSSVYSIKFQLESAMYKIRNEVRGLVNKGDTRNARTLAKELISSRKQKDRLLFSKATLGSIHTKLSQQLGAYIIKYFFSKLKTWLIAMIKLNGALQKSTDIMSLSSSLVKLPHISQTIRELSMEMTKVRQSLNKGSPTTIVPL